MNTDNFYSKDVPEVKSVTVPSNLSYTEAMNDIEEVKSFAKHFKERAEEIYAENQKLKNLLNEAITLADTMSDEINQNWSKESKLAVAKLNLIIEKAGWKRFDTSSKNYRIRL